MAINQISTANTFQQWLSATQALITAQNYFESNVAAVAVANTNIQAMNTSLIAANVAAISNIQSAQAVAYANVATEQSVAYANVSTAQSVAYANVVTIQSTAYANIQSSNAFIQAYNVAAISNIQTAQSVAYANVETKQSDAYANVNTKQSAAYANVVTIQSNAYANVNSIYGSAVTLSILVQDKSNTTNTTAQTVFDYTTTAFNTANSSNTIANQAAITAQLAYDTANLALSNLSFSQATVNAYNKANAAYDKANTANVLAQNSYDFANTVNTYSQSAYSIANAAFLKSNTTSNTAQAAFDAANAAGSSATVQAAYSKANSAYDQANTDVTSINTTAGVYGGATAIPVITLSANGRVAAISNVTITPGLASISDDVSTGSVRYLTMVNVSTGSATALNVSSTQLYFVPSTGTLSSTQFNSLSDERLKNNIITLNNATDVVNQLNGVEFTWKENGLKSYGVIAQELEKVLPELVQDAETKTVNYSGIIAFLINSIKELDSRIKDLENK